MCYTNLQKEKYFMKTKRNLLLGIISICILVLSLAFALVDAIVPLNLWTHPVLNFLFGIFVGFGIMTLVLAFRKALPWFFFVSAILLSLAGLYVVCQYFVWWICIIIIVVFLAIFAVVSLMTAGNMTENIALNKSPDYKTFEQRKAEEKEKASGEEKTEKPLPKIKSFKD